MLTLLRRAPTMGLRAVLLLLAAEPTTSSNDIAGCSAEDNPGGCDCTWQKDEQVPKLPAPLLSRADASQSLTGDWIQSPTLACEIAICAQL